MGVELKNAGEIDRMRVAGRIVAEFAGNLNASLGAGAGAAPRPASLNLGRLVWDLIRTRLARLFGG